MQVWSKGLGCCKAHDVSLLFFFPRAPALVKSARLPSSFFLLLPEIKNGHVTFNEDDPGPVSTHKTNIFFSLKSSNKKIYQDTLKASKLLLL